jgi:hypothetical protein
MAKQGMPPVLYDTVNMIGGMDEMTPNLILPTGMVRTSLNFEPSILGGYTRIPGYERYDGHGLASTAVYQLVYVSSFINIPSAGQTISGGSSGATGYVLGVGPNYVVTSEQTGSWTLGELISVGATQIGNYAAQSGSITPLLLTTYIGLAADRKRTYASAVPGSGAIRGVFVLNDLVYAFRDNAGGTAEALYVESAAGWVLVPYFSQVSFTAGTTAPADGATLTQGAVTATIKRVCRQSGAWAGSAVGKFIITTPSGGGGHFAAGAATATGGTTITLSGVETAITMLPGGKFDIDIGNFSGQSNTIRVYGADGVNKAFEFDGTTLVPIDTGFTPDAPSHVQVHKNYLFVSVSGSLGFSAPGLPFVWNSTENAGVVAVGDNITNMLELPGMQSTAAMGVWCRSTTFILYGTGYSTWNLVPLNTGCGGIPFTAQNMAHTYVADDRGIIDMQATLNYGNFDVDTLTYRINNFYGLRRSKIVAATLNRQKSQYRLFFNDGYAVYVQSTHGEEPWMNTAAGVMPIYFPNPVSIVVEAKISNGDEVIYFGSTNGFVYKMDSGTSFDGLPIPAYLNFGPNTFGSPRILKRFRRASVDATSSSYFEVGFGYKLDYNLNRTMQPNIDNYISNISPLYWDGFTWDSFTWDGITPSPLECDMKGTAINCALSFTSNSAIFNAFTINSSIVHYTPRRGVR